MLDFIACHNKNFAKKLDHQLEDIRAELDPLVDIFDKSKYGNTQEIADWKLANE